MEIPPPMSTEEIRQAVQALRKGLLVAFPTETVYGLGADASNPQALDLLYRVNVVNITVPPLRQRLADIRPLANRFIAQAAETHHRTVARVAEGFYLALERYEWPGTIRQLRSRIKKIAFAERGLSSALPDYVDTGQLSLPLDGGDAP